MRTVNIQMAWDEQYPGWTARSSYTHTRQQEDGKVSMRDITFRSTDANNNPAIVISEVIELTAREADVHPASLTAVAVFPADDLYDNRERYRR